MSSRTMSPNRLGAEVETEMNEHEQLRRYRQDIQERLLAANRAVNVKAGQADSKAVAALARLKRLANRYLVTDTFWTRLCVW